MNKIELVVDIGSSRIKIYQIDKGVVLNEASVCLVKINKKKLNLLEVGDNVFSTDIKTEKDISIIYPINQGIIEHKKAFYLMMKSFFEKIIPKKLIKPNIKCLIEITEGMNNIEKKALEDIFLELGISENIFIESPICSQKFYGVEPILILDIGSSKTEIAIVNNNKILVGASLNIAGDKFTEDIVKYVENKYKIVLTKNMAENAKIKIATLYDHDSSNILIYGRNIITNEKTEIRLTAQDCYDAILGSINLLCDTIEKMTLMIPKSIVNEIYTNGIFLVGGSANLNGIREFIERKIKLKVATPLDVSLVTLEGGAKILQNKEIISKVLSLEKF